MNEATMSPISLRRQIDQVITELGNCVQLCRDIKLTRHASSTVNLDNLKSVLKSAQEEILDEYDRLRIRVGREFEYGDGKLLLLTLQRHVPEANSKQIRQDAKWIDTSEASKTKSR